jgi:hypothetical protein
MVPDSARFTQETDDETELAATPVRCENNQNTA